MAARPVPRAGFVGRVLVVGKRSGKELAKPVRFHPVETDGARHAARLISELI